MDRARQEVKLGEVFAKETTVTACTFFINGVLLQKCPFYEPCIRRESFCGYYDKEIRIADRRPEFCELTLVRIEGIRRV